MKTGRVKLPSSLSRRAAPALLPLGLSVVGSALAAMGAADRINSAVHAVVWAVVAATMLVPAWRDRREPALILDEEGVHGPRGEPIHSWVRSQASGWVTGRPGGFQRQCGR